MILCSGECVCVCVVERVREREKHRVSRKKINCILTREYKNVQLLEREGEGAYWVTFSWSSLTTTASWERGGVLSKRWSLKYLLNMCHTTLHLWHISYDTRRWDAHMLEYPKVCSHTREVEFDSQHTPSNATSDRWTVGSYWSSGQL